MATPEREKTRSDQRRRIQIGIGAVRGTNVQRAALEQQARRQDNFPIVRGERNHRRRGHIDMMMVMTWFARSGVVLCRFVTAVVMMIMVVIPMPRSHLVAMLMRMGMADHDPGGGGSTHAGSGENAEDEKPCQERPHALRLQLVRFDCKPESTGCLLATTRKTS
jgi:hypothetical protein